MRKRNLLLVLPLIILSSCDILENSLYNTVEDEERDAVKTDGTAKEDTKETKEEVYVEVNTEKDGIATINKVEIIELDYRSIVDTSAFNMK